MACKELAAELLFSASKTKDQFDYISQTEESHRRKIMAIMILDMWVEFVVGSCRCSESFLRVLRFSFLHKNKHSKFQWKQWKRRATSWNVGWSWKSIPTNYLPHHECGTDLPGRVDGRSTPNSWRRGWRLWNLLGSQRLVEVNKSRCQKIRALFTAMQAGYRS